MFATYQAWHGDDIKEYDNMDKVMNDKFYSGKSLNDLVKEDGNESNMMPSVWRVGGIFISISEEVYFE